MKNLWEDSSMICIQGAPFIRWWRIFCVELLGTNCKSTVSKKKIPSRPPCVFHFHPCPQIEARPSQSLGPYQGSPEKQNTFHRYTKEQWHIWFNMAIRQFSKTTSYLWRCLSSTEVAFPYLWYICNNYISLHQVHNYTWDWRIWGLLFSYSLADLQPLTWKYVLLDPSLIVAPIWVFEPCESVVRSIQMKMNGNG